MKGGLPTMNSASGQSGHHRRFEVRLPQLVHPQHRVIAAVPAEIDVGAFGEHRLRHAVGIVVQPVAEPADPQHQLGDLRRARVLLEPVNWCGPTCRLSVAAERLDGFDHARFERLHQLHRHVEEVAGAAGGIEHADGGKASWKAVASASPLSPAGEGGARREAVGG